MALFGSSGARGPVDGEMDPSLVARIARAAVDHLDADRVAIGRDARLTGPALAAAATAGAAAGGADVERLGVSPTPAVQHHAEGAGVPAMVVTASHNPPTDNGIKLVDDDGGELAMDDYRAIEDRLDAGDVASTDWSAFGAVERVIGVNRRYVEALAEELATPALAEADLAVVVDPANGPGALTSPRLFRDLGCTVHTLNADLDGRFPNRRPEPVPEALGDLADAVVALDADLGVAHDGDADRAVFVDETGSVLDGGAVFAALAADAVGPDDVVVAGISASKRLADVASEAGACLELTRVGAAHILTRVRELEAGGTTVAIAGEENGGLVYPAHRLARDGAYTAGRFLHLVAERPASAVVEPYAGVAFRRRDLRYGDEAERAAMLERAERWARDAPGRLRTVDGFRLDREEGWILVRASGTEPLVRVYAEADDAATAGALIEEAVEAVA
ncbi:MAG: phosphoglucosamine mutase [Halobacteriales archaeon]